MNKVLIYAVLGDRLLVFDEPDFPFVPMQVPGGTLEPGEDALTGAQREFYEETGLSGAAVWQSHGSYLSVHWDRDGQKHHHRRHVFSVTLGSPQQHEWIHFENHAFDGSPPIRFRLFFLPWKEARAQIGLAMDAPLFWPSLQSVFA
ncbi:NUDIX domain-containing protein [Martelella alba]|uniref:NUDIX domain-containing protein n=1 Tax=Martelella alba TaxID=2590451 RepID=A0A506UFU3_9HYPH|nr:NUDIX domain-containing protein [Martelella alba]TPW32191.1 NUDIX domain-containing protein [Martelella alba]